jgi:hypothetical protein
MQSLIGSRAGWKSVMEAQGFHSVVVVGEETHAPELLARQSVVAGISSGVVRIIENSDSLVPMQLPLEGPTLNPSILGSFSQLPIRHVTLLFLDMD